MIRTGMGIILGIATVILFQAIQVHEKNIVSDSFKTVKWTSSAINRTESKMGDFTTYRNFSEYIGMPSTRFEPFTEEFEPKVQSAYTGGSFEADYPKKRMQRKFMQFFVMLKFAGNSHEGISFRSSF